MIPVVLPLDPNDEFISASEWRSIWAMLESEGHPVESLWDESDLVDLSYVEPDDLPF